MYTARRSLVILVGYREQGQYQQDDVPIRLRTYSKQVDRGRPEPAKKTTEYRKEILLSHSRKGRL